MSDTTETVVPEVAAAAPAPAAAAAPAPAAAAAPAAGATKEVKGGAEAATETKTLLSDDEGDGAGGVPVEYTFTPPDDIGKIEMTDVVKAEFDSFNARAKEAGLSQAQYQKIVEGEIRRGRAAIQEAVAGYQRRIDDWATDTKADKEMGGADLKENLSVAVKALDTYGSPALRALLDTPSAKNPTGLGLGNHPEIIRLLHRVGKQLQEEGNLVSGDSGDAAAQDASLRRMYPSMFKETAARN